MIPEFFLDFNVLLQQFNNWSLNGDHGSTF